LFETEVTAISHRSIPVIDVFAGPGGLGEGFHQFKRSSGKAPFRIALSIEKDPFAYQTLKMRSFYRQFSADLVPKEFYAAIRSENPEWRALETEFPKEMARVDEEVWNAELGCIPTSDLNSRIKRAIDGYKTWVLIGGPPCQAYSLVGRARMSRRQWHHARDPRHTLYVEYLRILAEHHPAVFVIENVKGILSSRRSGQLIVDSILRDLQRPCKASGQCRNDASYRVYALANYDGTALNLFLEEPGSYIVRAENHGVPQARHRFIVLGVREDIGAVPEMLKDQDPIPMWDAIKDLPRLRSRLSRGDSAEMWSLAIARVTEIIAASNGFLSSDLRAALVKAAAAVRKDLPVGAHFMSVQADPLWKRQWFFDPRLAGVLNHCSRSHIFTDLWRYLYASIFAAAQGRSPRLQDFPKILWPAHKNLKNINDTDELAFDDRFRVQVKSRPATTVTSHISKDGHYFIHPDPRQCRTLTVREAARLQTFPDNYVFLGPRTEQYRQVGNAVPPLLALQIAGIVEKLL
jgi:DNA (cytosine-5)-methyltransferase 1